ncbi:hypothetical protein LOC68_17770 [Blastopirellula sp. JC732]|uniref:Transmembrane protein n=1 Tax=Blastopirellula sediminis TaxID=2894196 RepID=A0A9X1MNY3_9BACT|nr:hypothetical protein [Blastopirellula sediminis]MCC9606456.1 hypothetical protein [Blastopirellula sediminis]MCC9630246.1 hypothetical protein [Blastopirellula sediminis]
MEFRRNAARDDRRRRAILDDRNAAGRNAGVADGDDAACGKRARRYSSQALLERRIRVVDLIPLHWFSVASYYLLGVVLISLLAVLHFFAAEKVAFANLSSVNSLGGWLAIVVFWTAAQGALVIYRIRRHRLDDYRGRYHVWLWGVAVLGIAGVDLLVDFRTPIGQMIEHASGRQFADLEQGWALLVATSFYGLALLRIVWEVRASRGALASALLSLTALGTFVASQANLILWPEQVNVQLTTCVLYLGGVWLLSMMLMQYARFVWMDAIGLIAQRAVVEADEEEEKAPAKKTSRRRPTIVKKEEEAEAQEASEDDADSGWFSWGSKKSKPAVEEEETEKTPASKRAAKPTVKAAAKSDEDETPAEKKRGWFGWGRKNPAEGEAADADAKVAAKPAPAKPAAAKKEEKSDEAAAPKRGWFGFGAKKEAAPDVAAEKKQPAPKAAEKRPAKEEAATEKKRGWFGFGGKAKTEEEPAEEKKSGSPLAASARRAVVKQQQASTSAPPQTLKMDPLTLGGNDEGDSDDEIAALEAKPDHLLTKAERRRLKKLKRRGVAA